MATLIKYLGLFTFIFLILYFSGCLTNYAATKNSLEVASKNEIDIDSDGLPDRIVIVYTMFQAPGINTTRKTTYNLEYRYSESTQEIVNESFQIPEETINKFTSAKFTFDDLIYSCKEAINYWEIRTCTDYPNCMIACKKSALCEAYLTNNYEQGIRTIKDIANKISDIEKDFDQLQLMINSNNVSGARNISYGLIEKYSKLYSATLNSPCAGTYVDPSYVSELYNSLKDSIISNITKDIIRKKTPAEIKFKVSDEVIVFSEKSYVYTKLKLNYTPVVSNVFNVKVSVPPYGNFTYQNSSFIFSYESIRDNPLDFSLQSYYEYQHPNFDYQSIINKQNPFGVDVSFIPDDSLKLATVYVIIFSSIDSIINAYDTLFGTYIGFGLLLFTFYLIIMILVKYLGTTLAIINAVFSKNPKVALMQLAGKHDSKYLIYLFVSTFIIIAIIFYVPKTRLESVYTEFKVVTFTRVLLADYLNTFLGLSLCLSAVLLKKSVIEIIKILVLGEQYYLSDEDKLKKELLVTKKEIVKLKSDIDSLFSQVKDLGLMQGILFKTQEEYLLLPIPKILNIKDNAIISANKEKLINYSSLIKNTKTRMSVIKAQLDNLVKTYKQDKDNWFNLLTQKLEKYEKITEHDLIEIGVPEMLYDVILNEFYSKIDKNVYGLQNNTIYKYPKDFIESNVFTLISSTLKTKNILLSSVIFDKEGNIIQENLPRDSSRSVMRVMMIKLLSAVKRLLEINYAKNINYMLINLSKATAVLVLGKNRNMLLVVSKNANLSEVLAFTKPLVSDTLEQKNL
ncbi:MAG: hypothetical protein N3E37_01695 [Candidatus Micrarchaeota archaeon]|nr:hypothetical protein [Candidatus Micrarchaeota archaeon]